MTRTTHTPGPWVDSITMGRSEKGVVAEAFAWMGRGPVIVATRAVREGEHMHNARLIAAAPEMAIEIAKQIDWLKHARTECAGAASGSLLLGFDQSIKYLTAVLAKATGEKA